jgi:hypothetical protein
MRAAARPVPDTSARRALVSVDVVVDAPVEVVWAAVVDWERQGDWVLGTRVRVTSGSGEGLGTRLEAVTGVGPLALVDTMVVTEWEPPNRCVVRHTGTLVRGIGVFEVLALPHGRSRFVWREELDLPLGRAGRAGWPFARPLLAAGVRASLRRLARRIEQR